MAKSIINVRRLLRYAGVVGGNHNGRQKPEIMVGDVIVGGELFTDYSDHPRKLVTNQKLKSTGAGRYQLLSRCAYRKQLGLKDFSPEKSGRAVALQQIKERRFTYD